MSDPIDYDINDDNIVLAIPYNYWQFNPTCADSIRHTKIEYPVTSTNPDYSPLLPGMLVHYDYNHTFVVKGITENRFGQSITIKIWPNIIK